MPFSATAPLTRANNEFGFRLLKEVKMDSPEKNIFVSPLSIQLALQMTYMGARVETKRQIAEVLSLVDLEKEEVAQYSHHLLDELSGFSDEIDLSIANSIWARKGLPFKAEFLDMNKEYYQAKVEQLDFGSSGAVEKINGWVRRETQEKIKKMVDRLDPLDIMVLINAVYFQGSWKMEFEEENTKQEPFYLPDGSKELRMMRKEDRFHYLEMENFQLIRLPYGEQEKLAAYVVLPTEEYGLDKLISELSWERWQNWKFQMERDEVQLALPRFKLRYKRRLNEPLQAMGMKLAFDDQQADLTGIIDVTDQNAFISKVNHKTFLKVTEEGTEAAAATGVVINYSLESLPSEMIVDHPFLFAIADERTDTLLFLGGIWEPERVNGAE